MEGLSRKGRHHTILFMKNETKVLALYPVHNLSILKRMNRENLQS